MVGSSEADNKVNTFVVIISLVVSTALRLFFSVIQNLEIYVQIPHKHIAIILMQGSSRAYVVCVAHLEKDHTPFFFILLFLLLQQNLVFCATLCLQIEQLR